MDEKLVNEYINNLANKINELTQENLLFKTRLSLKEQEVVALTESIQIQTKELQELREFPEPKAPEANVKETNFSYDEKAKVVDKPRIPETVRAPRPNGYNPKVDGPLPMIPNPKLKDTK